MRNGYINQLLKLLGPILWLLEYEITFHTNQLSKKVTDFHQFKPAEFVSFQR